MVAPILKIVDMVSNNNQIFPFKTQIAIYEIS